MNGCLCVWLRVDVGFGVCVLVVVCVLMGVVCARVVRVFACLCKCVVRAFVRVCLCEWLFMRSFVLVFSYVFGCVCVWLIGCVFVCVCAGVN